MFSVALLFTVRKRPATGGPAGRGAVLTLQMGGGRGDYSSPFFDVQSRKPSTSCSKESRTKSSFWRLYTS